MLQDLLFGRVIRNDGHGRAKRSQLPDDRAFDAAVYQHHARAAHSAFDPLLARRDAWHEIFGVRAADELRQLLFRSI